jgi:hypothetical protein
VQLVAENDLDPDPDSDPEQRMRRGLAIGSGRAIGSVP